MAKAVNDNSQRFNLYQPGVVPLIIPLGRRTCNCGSDHINPVIIARNTWYGTLMHGLCLSASILLSACRHRNTTAPFPSTSSTIVYWDPRYVLVSMYSAQSTAFN